jgi:hypothetical protein
VSFEIRCRRLGSLLTTVAWLSGSASAAQPPDRRRADTPVATAQRTTGTIHIEGRLDEPDWQRTSSIGPLVQREPIEGQEATEATDVRILFDDDALYIGIRCHESHPGRAGVYAADARCQSRRGRSRHDRARPLLRSPERFLLSGQPRRRAFGWAEFQQRESRLLSVQSRFRWILKPGTDLFVVVNRGWVKTFDDGLESIFDRASSKLQYTFRF